MSVGSASTLELDEIRGVVSALRAIEHPGDPLLVYAALKGFLFGVSDELLLEYKTRYGGFDALARPRTAMPKDLVPVAHGLALLGGLHLRRNVRPPAETLFELLAATRGHLTMPLSPSAEQAMTDLASLAQRAVQHERRGGLSFRAFIDDLVESPLPSADSEWDVHGRGVRIMTAHRAKGLEFPIVGQAFHRISIKHSDIAQVFSPTGAVGYGCKPCMGQINQGADRQADIQPALASRNVDFFLRNCTLVDHHLKSSME